MRATGFCATAAVIVIAAMLSLPILPAYAAGTYDSSLSVGDNGPDAEFFSVDVCYYTGDAHPDTILIEGNEDKFVSASDITGKVSV